MLSRCMLLVAAVGCSQAFGTVILEENFESLPLRPNTEETRGDLIPVGSLGIPVNAEGVPTKIADGGVIPADAAGLWTPVPPAEWTIDNSGVPGFGGTVDEEGNPVRANDGVDEWEGWTFARKDFFTTEGQSRQLFSRGQGTVAVADPDEFDDAAPGIPGAGGPTFNTKMSTPFVDFTGVAGSKLVIEFDSSFRGEDKTDEGDDNQTGVVTASFGFGFLGDVEVLRWAPNAINPYTGLADPAYQPGITEDTLALNPFLDMHVIAVVNLPDGIAGSGLENVSVSFGMETARNDWWWAIDNVKLSIVPEPASFAMVALGLAGLAARRR